MSEWITLKQAAELLGRSTARTRQYLHDGEFGEFGEGWRRNEMGHIEVKRAAVEAYQPTGISRSRAGVRASTKLRHLRATIKLVDSMVPESDARRVCRKVLDAVLEAVEDQQKREEAGIQDKPAPEAAPTQTVATAPDEIEDEDFEAGILNL